MNETYLKNYSSFYWFEYHMKLQIERSYCHKGKLYLDKNGFLFKPMNKRKYEIFPKDINFDKGVK
jgi:hypothetical protein